MNNKVTPEVIKAAQSLLAQAQAKTGSGHASQVHEVILRSEDVNEDPEKFPLLHIVPLGNIIGFAITRYGEAVKDSDYIFVHAHALAAAIPAMGFIVSMRAGETYNIIDPQ